MVATWRIGLRSVCGEESIDRSRNLHFFAITADMNCEGFFVYSYIVRPFFFRRVCSSSVLGNRAVRSKRGGERHDGHAQVSSERLAYEIS